MQKYNKRCKICVTKIQAKFLSFCPTYTYILFQYYYFHFVEIAGHFQNRYFGFWFKIIILFQAYQHSKPYILQMNMYITNIKVSLFNAIFQREKLEPLFSAKLGISRRLPFIFETKLLITLYFQKAISESELSARNLNQNPDGDSDLGRLPTTLYMILLHCQQH